jgi:hypothetical protein
MWPAPLSLTSAINAARASGLAVSGVRATKKSYTWSAVIEGRDSMWFMLRPCFLRSSNAPVSAPGRSCRLKMRRRELVCDGTVCVGAVSIGEYTFE